MDELKNYDVTGSCFGSFGELLQGFLPGNKKFLVNLKIASQSQAFIKLNTESTNYSDEYSKSHQVIQNILKDNNENVNYTLSIKSTIPRAKGLSSSTADMVAVFRAMAQKFPHILDQEYISSLLTKIEPNDGLHIPGTAAYYHTEGKLIYKHPFIPNFKIIGIDFGGTVDTVEFNKEPKLVTKEEEDEYLTLLSQMEQSLLNRDEESIAKIATMSFSKGNHFLNQQEKSLILDLADKLNALGIVNSHSGTYVGLIFSRSISEVDLQKAKDTLAHSFSGKDIRVFETAKSD